MWLAILASVVGGMAGYHADAAGGLPFFELGHITVPVVGLKLQWFGILVATGVLTGAHLGRKYGDRYRIDDEDLRGMTAWVVVSGFIGAHVFDVLAYQREKMADDPLLIIKLWEGISSYGGFIGGAIGWWLFTWWKRLTIGLWADLTIIGLMTGFSIGRIGCTVVHDHMGRQTSFWLGTDYPTGEVRGRVCEVVNKHYACPDWVNSLPEPVARMHNLGMYELLYLIPVNALILWLAFRKKQSNAGTLAVLLGLLYAPVRFFFEFLRFNETDPRYAGLTFAQWMSITAFLAAGYFLIGIIRNGKPAPYASELPKGEVGGRLHAGPKLTRKHLADLKEEEAAERAKEREKDESRKAAIKPGKKSGAKKETAKEAEPEPAAADDDAKAEAPEDK